MARCFTSCHLVLTDVSKAPLVEMSVTICKLTWRNIPGDMTFSNTAVNFFKIN